MTLDRTTDGFAHDDANAWLITRASTVQVDDDGAPGRLGPTTGGVSEVSRSPKPVGGGKHEASGGQPYAALGAPRSEDRAAGAGAHPKPEPMRLGPTAGVGLEGTLHGLAPGGLRAGKTGAPGRGKIPRQGNCESLRNLPLHGQTGVLATPRFPQASASTCLAVSRMTKVSTPVHTCG